MKFEKWTLVLAATGVVSLASAAKAEEKPSAVMTALSSTTLSGYVDTSAQWNFGTGNANPAPYKFNSSSKADGFNLDVVQLRVDKPLDEAEWAAGYRVDLWLGPDANTLNTVSTGLAGHGDFAIRQAYVALRTPVGNGIDWKIGVFDSIIGYESVESPNDPNYTRSYGHTIEPQTHTGLVGTYRFSDMISASAGVADTVGPVINSRDFPTSQTVNPYPESYKTYMGSVALTAPDTMGVLSGSTVYGGVVNGFNNGSPIQPGAATGVPSTSFYVGTTVATPVTGLRLGAAWDWLAVNTHPNGGVKNERDLWSIAGYASYQVNEKLSLHGRLELYAGDIDSPAGSTVAFAGLGPFRENAIYAATLTAQYDLWKNVLSRVELRWDHAEHGNLFGGTTPGFGLGGANANNAFLLAANVIYKF
jgi:hypothetical protein